MPIRMLIDASHEEETRVAIVRGNRVEEFDYESTSRKPLKGNIYLAKVTRVEPSLQAAFVDYGGNRHGFLAFSEIHPDYYQIPVADREALIAEEAKANADILEQDAVEDKKTAEAGETPEESGTGDASVGESDGDGTSVEPEDAETVESMNQDDEEEEARLRLQMARRLRRKYKIQEVIKKHQVILVQVVKEERGNKGAALTTYLSLPGRYCVLMPNTLHGGGISRKISSAKDRKRLKSLLADLNMPEGMACIIRTAGFNRTKLEIKRDYDYLSRMWRGIREVTLKSIAPALIYEEGNLIKRSIRDLYTREIDEVLVEGEEGYKTAKSFMKLLMPSHAKKVQHYQDTIPLFQRFQVESHLDSMYNPTVQLRSGGYIVINPTEALVSIDVNSGKATKEHNIEETATKTNLEAAEEIARQLRLRDMAGLIVIDFIDMEDRGNVRSVERKVKECLKSDRARIQVGRISGFGLMEMSRQRLRPGVLESSTRTCPHCDGIGTIRSVDSQALHIIRVIEEEGIRNRSSSVVLYLPTNVAIYLLNHKRRQLLELETRYGFTIGVSVDESLTENGYRLERAEGGTQKTESKNSLQLGGAVPTPTLADVTEDDVSPEGGSSAGDGEQQPKRRRRRRRRKSRDERAQEEKSRSQDGGGDVEEIAAESPADAPDITTDDGEAQKPARKRRSRRRPSRDKGDGVETADTAETSSDTVPEAARAGDQTTEGPADSTEPAESEAAVPEAKDKEAADREQAADKAEKPKRRRVRAPKGRDIKDQGAKTPEKQTPEKQAPEDKDATDTPPIPKPVTPKPVAPEPAAAEATQEKKPAKPEPEPSPFANVIEVGGDKQPDAKKPAAKKGWWQRTFGD